MSQNDLVLSHSGMRRRRRRRRRRDLAQREMIGNAASQRVMLKQSAVGKGRGEGHLMMRMVMGVGERMVRVVMMVVRGVVRQHRRVRRLLVTGAGPRDEYGKKGGGGEREKQDYVCMYTTVHTHAYIGEEKGQKLT